MNYTNKVELKMNEYLEKAEVTIQDILGNTDAFVFGGALRDAIADVEINDIDIIGFSRSLQDIKSYLLYNDFTEYIGGKLDSCYSDIHIICPPTTYEKNGCRVQLIKPHGGYLGQGILNNSIEKVHWMVRTKLLDMIEQVDIDICALAYNNVEGLLELIPNVINHINVKVFYVLEDNIMHQKDRIHIRVRKMINKGYTPLNIKPIKMEELKRYNAWEE